MSFLIPHRFIFCSLLIGMAILVDGGCRSAQAQDKPATKAILRLIASSESAPTPTPESKNNDEGPIKIRTDLVTLTLTVQDLYGRYISGLTKKSFSVTDNKVEQDISFFSDADAPASIGIIFDMSGSMSGDKISKSKKALDHFIKTCHPSDEYSLIAFNQQVQLLVDRTRDPDTVLSKLSLGRTKGNTALYDAVYLGVDRIIRGAHQK